MGEKGEKNPRGAQEDAAYFRIKERLTYSPKWKISVDVQNFQRNRAGRGADKGVANEKIGKTSREQRHREKALERKRRSLKEGRPSNIQNYKSTGC